MSDVNPTQWSAIDYLEAAANAEYRYVDGRAERAKVKCGRLERKIQVLRNWGPLRFISTESNSGDVR